MQHGSEQPAVCLPLPSSPRVSQRLPARLFPDWILGAWPGAGCAPGISRWETQKLFFFFFKDGRGRLAQSATLLRLRVCSTLDRGGKHGPGLGGGGCPKRQFVPPHPQKDILTRFWNACNTERETFPGGGGAAGWTIKFNSACRSDLPPRQTSSQTVGAVCVCVCVFLTRSPPCMATGC